jgi:hypothetical protein
MYVSDDVLSHTLDADEDINMQLAASRTAIPDYYAKLTIYQARDKMLEAFYNYNKNTSSNNGRANPFDKVECEERLKVVFDLIKEMIVSQISMKNMQEKTPLNHKAYHMLIAMSYGKNFSFQELLFMKDFLLNRLHTLKITDLLKEAINPFDEFKNW